MALTLRICPALLPAVASLNMAARSMARLCLQAALAPRGQDFCAWRPDSSIILGMGTCDITCGKCTPCAGYDYCAFCVDSLPVDAPDATCSQLARPRQPQCPAPVLQTPVWSCWHFGSPLSCLVGMQSPSAHMVLHEVVDK